MPKLSRVTVISFLLLLSSLAFRSLAIPASPARNLVFAQSDVTDPITEAALNPSSPDGGNGWYVSPLSVVLTATDLESGVQSINWRLNDGGWQSHSFTSGLNLAPNPSFEVGSDTPDEWEFSGTAGAGGSRDPSQSKFGSAAAKISATVNGWSGWWHENFYSVVTPPTTLTASLWLKTENVSGVGAFFKVYALSPAGSSLVTETSAAAVSGTTDWTRFSASFEVSDPAVFGVFIDAGLEGVGSAWVDGVSLSESTEDPVVDLAFSQNGEHNFYYYSLDYAGNQESTHQISFKIDTVAPGNWHDFDVTRCLFGNSHELYSWISVSDETSGLQPFTDDFQYSTDAGENWGYHENLRQCSSTWHESGWWDLFSWFPWPGIHDLTLVTPCVDYCNSNWNVCKITRFRIEDMAGNQSTRDICINGAWSRMRGGGDAYAGANISISAAGSEPNVDGVVVSSGTSIANFDSTRGWEVVNAAVPYPPVPPRSYEDWRVRYSQAVTIDRLPTSDGYFIVDGPFSIGGATIPGGLATADFSAVLFVNGNLTINDDYSLGPSGAIVFIVSGDVRIGKRVEDIAGFFFADGKFDTAYNGNQNLPVLNIRGGIHADHFVLSRSLGHYDNVESPAEDLSYEPRYLFLMAELLGEVSYQWREVAN